MIRAALLAAFACASALPAQAADIRLFGTGAVQHSVQDIIAAFEKETGHKVITSFGTAGAIGKKLAAGEPVDVALSSVGGLILSYNLDIPAGPAIVLTAGGFWLLSLVADPRASLWRQAIPHA